MMIKAKKHAGFTILELLIAALLTSIIATAAFSFFIRTNEQYLSQDDISEMQQNVRASIQNITRELRMAGYCITDTTIIPLAIDSLSGLTDTLTIRRDTFTVKFYVDHSDSLHPALMKEVNGQAQVFADEISGMPLSRYCFEGPEEELKKTYITQPAIFVHSIAVLNILQEMDIKPEGVAGHSLGEYSAILAAGVIDFPTALEIVKERARLMEEAGELGRAILKNDDAEFVDAIGDVVVVETEDECELDREDAEDHRQAPSHQGEEGRRQVGDNHGYEV